MTKIREIIIIYDIILKFLSISLLKQWRANKQQKSWMTFSFFGKTEMYNIYLEKSFHAV